MRRFCKTLVPTWIFLGAFLTASLQADGYHTPFRSKEELKIWWNTVFQALAPQTSGAATSSQISSCCPRNRLQPELRAGINRLFETLKFLHAHNIIKTEFPDLTGPRIADIRSETVRILASLGRQGAAYVIHELILEIRFPIDGGGRMKAEAYARNHIMEYASQCQEEIQKLERQLDAAKTEGEARIIRNKIDHIRAGLQREHLDEIRNKLVSELVRTDLRQGPNYKENLKAVVIDMEGEALCCLTEFLEDSNRPVRVELGSILRALVIKLSGRAKAGMLTLKENLPEILNLLDSDYSENRVLGFECLRQITGQNLGSDAMLWRTWLAEHFSPEIASKILRK